MTSTDSSPSQYPHTMRVRFIRWIGRIRYAGVLFITILACILISNPGALARVGASSLEQPPDSSILQLAQVQAPPNLKPSQQAIIPANPGSTPANTTSLSKPQKESQPTPVARPEGQRWWNMSSHHIKMVIFIVILGGFVLFGGAFGGLIYSISSNRGAISWHSVTLQGEDKKTEYKKWNLGVYGDMLVGAGGGVIVFNLIPQVSDGGLIKVLWMSMSDTGTAASTLMKILALSLIGGFAGISLFDEAARKISKQMQEISQQVDANSNQLSGLNQVGSTESQIRFLLSRAVDKSLSPLGPAEVDQLRGAVIKAPLQVRNYVFDTCQQAIESNRLLGISIPLNVLEIQSRVTQLKGLIHCFESLRTAATESEKSTNQIDLNSHRYLAHIGFIREHLAIGLSLLGEGEVARENLVKAEVMLGQAIESRDNQAASTQKEFWHYSLHRSFCRFRLGLLDKAGEDLLTPMAMTWATSLVPGLVFTNLKGFSPPLLSIEVRPSQYVADNFFSWVSSLRPELVPKELLASEPNRSGEFQQGGELRGQRDDEDASQDDRETTTDVGQAGQTNSSSTDPDPDHAQSIP